MRKSPKNEETIKIPIGKVFVEGNLVVSRGAKAIIVFAHGSGSSRFSPRNRFVADVLQKHSFATLLMDLLTKEEEAIDTLTAHLRFDIEMLADRLLSATYWLKKNSETKELDIGYFGASTGAAAALIAATKYPDSVYAIVSRGGRPDLAMQHLPKVKAPTLLIVGGNDTVVIKMNKEALNHLKATKKLEIVAGASHLFEEPGKLENVANLAVDWFKNHLKQK